MKKIAYLRIFGIPEIDNINRAKYKLLECKVIEDKTFDGEIIDWLLKNNLDSLLLNNTTLANMIMCKIDNYNITKENINDVFDALNKNCTELRDFFESIGNYDMSRQVGYASILATTYTENIEALILSKEDKK